MIMTVIMIFDNTISNNGKAKYSSTKHNNINSNDDVDYNPSYNNSGRSLGDNNNNHDVEHNKTNNNNNNVRYNPHDNGGRSVRDANKYDRLYYHCCDASSIEHNNITNDNNIHYSPLSCNNDGSSLKYSDNNMKLTNTKRNNMISNNSVDFYSLHENDDGCLGSLCSIKDRLVVHGEKLGSLCSNKDRLVVRGEFIIYFVMSNDIDAVCDAVYTVNDAPPTTMIMMYNYSVYTNTVFLYLNTDDYDAFDDVTCFKSLCRTGISTDNDIDTDGIDHISEANVDNSTEANGHNEQKTINIRTNNHNNEWWFCSDYSYIDSIIERNNMNNNNNNNSIDHYPSENNEGDSIGDINVDGIPSLV